MVERQELHDGWSFREHGVSPEDAWRPCFSVPGTIHRDLQHHALIPDPFADMNDLCSRWVGERTWSYKTSFTSPKVGENTITDLVFKGLDTLATVTLNGKKILEADNMFLEYRIDISGKLELDGPNELLVDFAPAMLRGRELVKKHEHEHRFIAHQTEQGRLPIRKAQYHWGWDWGPIIMTAGIWRSVYLETYSIRIDDVWHLSEVDPTLKRVSGQLLARVSPAKPAKVRLALSFDGKSVFETTTECDADGLVKCDYSVNDPSLWYPAGYGKQARYELKATIVTELSDSPSASKLIGFRRVELVQQTDRFGKSFYFRINQVDVFAGGSCWIPADSFIPDITPQRYRDWMKLMIQGNQIMIRVWGGGVYEDDAFFDACDELGILAWQDFCMACQLSPTYQSFLKQLEDEARYNIRRLRHHPSLVIWAGNNEDYQIQEKYQLDYNFEDKDPESWLRSSFPARYIYESCLPQIVAEEDSAAIYHPSSPWGDGKPTADPTVGDVHQWNIWHGTMNRYQQAASMSGRFVSEFGMEGYPHLQTIRSSVTDPLQQHPGSILMDYRNRAIDHERRLIT
jgi:beta-mannosidase